MDTTPNSAPVSVPYKRLSLCTLYISFFLFELLRTIPNANFFRSQIVSYLCRVSATTANVASNADVRTSASLSCLRGQAKPPRSFLRAVYSTRGSPRTRDKGVYSEGTARGLAARRRLAGRDVYCRHGS